MIKKYKYLISIIIIILGVFGYLMYRPIEIQPSGTTLTPTETLPSRDLSREDLGESLKIENIICNNEKYVFDVSYIKEKDYYNTNIYKTSRVGSNLLVQLQSGSYKFFSVLAVPKKNCDRIYLTVGMASTDAPLKGIFEWRIGEKSVRELAISKEFEGDFIPIFYNWKSAVSSEGEKIIVAQPFAGQRVNKWSKDSCNFRTLRLLNLREDTSQILAQLPGNETFDRGVTEAGNCADVNLGWQNESTVYYDVYDVTAVGSPFKERKIFKIQ